MSRYSQIPQWLSVAFTSTLKGVLFMLVTGLSELKKSEKSPDLLKRNLRCCHHLVDSFLDNGELNTTSEVS